MLNEMSEADDTKSDILLISGGGSCSPGGTCYRYFALVLMCFLGFGSYFCFDNPGALQDVIIKDMSLTTTEFSYLYASYSWPNVILCFVGGFLIDRVFGIRFGTALYAFIVFLGQVIVSLGSILDNFLLMILGRVIFGIGGESLAVAQNYYAVLWFRGRELNMIFGLQLSFARLGSAINFIIMEPLYKYVHHYFKGREGLGISLLFASSTCLVSFLSAIGLSWLDRKQDPQSEQTNENEKKDEVKLSDVIDFSPAFWLISVICVAYYIAIFPLIALGKVFFMRKFDLNANDANTVNSMLYIISTIASPILGFVVDKTGWNLFWVFISISFTIGAHGLLAFTFLNPVYAMVILGISYSMCASALWPMISLVIPDHQLGSAYGVAQACQNFGLAICTMLAGVIVDNGGYLMLEVFFLIWLFVAIIACLCVWFYDMNTTGVLNMTISQRNAFEQNKGKNKFLENQQRAYSSSDISPYEVINPQSDFQIRNRYLARIGATNLPVHLDPSSGRVFRTLR